MWSDGRTTVHRRDENDSGLSTDGGGEEPAELVRVAEAGHGRVGSEGGDRGQHGGAVTPSPGQQPRPEFSAFAGSPQCLPAAAGQREVEDHHSVGSGKAFAEGVVGAEVPVDDPALGGDQLTLPHDPLIAGGRGRAGTPEQPVELDDRQPGDLAEAPRHGGLTGASAAQQDDALHVYNAAK